MADIRIRWDELQLDYLLRDPSGPVGQLILEISAEAATVARAKVRVRTTRGGSDLPPGYTKARIRVHVPRRGSRTGNLYGGVNAPGIPSIFMEYPAEQYKRQYPFLSTGLDFAMMTVL